MSLKKKKHTQDAILGKVSPLTLTELKTYNYLGGKLMSELPLYLPLEK